MFVAVFSTAVMLWNWFKIKSKVTRNQWERKKFYHDPSTWNILLCKGFSGSCKKKRIILASSLMVVDYNRFPLRKFIIFQGKMAQAACFYQTAGTWHFWECMGPEEIRSGLEPFPCTPGSQCELPFCIKPESWGCSVPPTWSQVGFLLQRKVRNCFSLQMIAKAFIVQFS